jgi:hypothetical protein
MNFDDWQAGAGMCDKCRRGNAQLETCWGTHNRSCAYKPETNDYEKQSLCKNCRAVQCWRNRCRGVRDGVPAVHAMQFPAFGLTFQKAQLYDPPSSE